MPASIEIFENTLLKLIVRQGADADRKNVLLDSGELAYATDTERLYVGDGATMGGVVVGNKFLGVATTVTSFTNATVGDAAYDSLTNTLYTCVASPPTVLSNWSAVGRVTQAGQSIAIDSTGVISLSSERIKTNNISPNDSEYLGLDSHPVSLNGQLKIRDVVYQFPHSGLENLKFLMTDVSGNLSWSDPVQNATYFVSNTANRIPVGSIMSFVSAAPVPSGWLLCNGQSVLTASYPDLFDAIRYNYGGSGLNFNIPNLTNKMLYGTSDSPYNSTTFRVASGTNITLSAAPMMFMIKAIPESLVSSTLTIKSPLTAVLNGVDVTNSTISTLSGSISIGLSSIHPSNQIVVGTFYTDEYGRVYNIESESNIINTAGTISNEASVNATEIYNYTSPIGFLKTPVVLCDTSRSSTTTQVLTTINVYPIITNINGAAVSPNQNLPANAKNVILEATINKTGPDGGDIDRYVVAAPTITLMNAINSTVVGNGEYLIAGARAAGDADNSRFSTQAIIPLSANSGNLSFGLRFSPSRFDAIKIRVIGYTL
jgi:microcystin-dependent protein